MFDFLRKLVTRDLTPPAEPAPAPAGRQVKVQGAEHPLVAANRLKPRAMAVGIVYGPDGAPKISADFLAALPGVHRTWVENDLQQHGWRLNADNTVTRLEG